MDAGLLSLAARRLAEMSEAEAENEIARLRPDELTSLVRYYNKKEREKLVVPEADVNQVAIKREHHTRSPSLEFVSTRACKKQRTNAETALEVASKPHVSRQIARANSGQQGSSRSTNSRRLSGAEGIPEGLARIETKSTAVTSRAKLSIPGDLGGTTRTREKPLAHVLWIPDSNSHWSWVCHDKLPGKGIADLVQLVTDRIVDTPQKRETWAQMLHYRDVRFAGKCICISKWVSGDFWNGLGMSLRRSKGEMNRACDDCIDAHRPCLRLIRLEDPVEIVIGWFPLPDVFRGKAPDSQKFWVMDE